MPAVPLRRHSIPKKRILSGLSCAKATNGDASEFKTPVATIIDHGSYDPRVVLKRAYPPSSSNTSPSESSHAEPKITLMRGISADRGSSVAECVSLASVAQTNASCSSRTSLDAPSLLSISRKPRLDRSEASLPLTSRSNSNVRRLPAYREKSKRSASSNIAIKENNLASTCLADASSVKSTDNLPRVTHGVNSDSLESVLKAATRVHNTRRSLKREVFVDMVCFEFSCLTFCLTRLTDST
ncbi:unnamed protein product [Echinostoma caproni]|uniref:Uncharacterized protein n=1 Tax=Echinostoma caproni TaxID=27848 RepID=A0A183AM12_9TREM|nr:unnamed protein product [Echinostoma caproni]